MDKRSAEALEVAEETLRMLEVDGGPLTPIVLRCLRIARLLGNETVVTWMRLELRGYGPMGPGENLDWGQYAKWSGRTTTNKGADGKPLFWILPLEELESALRSAREDLRTYQMPVASITETGVKEPSAFLPPPSVTEKVLDKVIGERNRAKSTVGGYTRVVSTLRGSIQEWLTHEVTQLKYGHTVDNAFARTKARFDSFLAGRGEGVGQALAAAYSASPAAGPEEWSQALTSCRRALKALADAVYPASSAVVDGHKLDDASYRNRLAQFVKESVSSSRQSGLLLGHLDTVIARIEALDALLSKGVHADVTHDEADLAVVHTYVLAGEMLALADIPTEVITPPSVDSTGAPPVASSPPPDGEDEANPLSRPDPARPAAPAAVRAPARGRPPARARDGGSL